MPNNWTAMQNPMKIAALVVASATLTACAGLAIPIQSRLPPDNSATDEAENAYENPRRLALGRIAQWDKAITNIQGANTASNTGLAGIAATLGYRAARDLSSAATVGWATAGLFGMGISEALVQVSRINVYSAGISGLECALAAYGPGHVGARSSSENVGEETTDRKVALLANTTRHFTIEELYELTSLVSFNQHESIEEIATLRAQSEAVLNEGLLLAISRITRDVDSALMGTILTATSRGRSWSGAFSAAIRDSSKSTRQAPARLTHEQVLATAIITRSLAEARASVATAKERRNRMDACSIGGATASIELVGTPLGIDLLGQKALAVTAGATGQFRVYGGTGTYGVTLGATSAEKPPVVSLSVDGVAIVTITTDRDTTPIEYAVIVADAAEGTSQLVSFRVVPAPAEEISED